MASLGRSLADLARAGRECPPLREGSRDLVYVAELRVADRICRCPLKRKERGQRFEVRPRVGRRHLVEQPYDWPAWWISGTPWPDAGEHDIAEILSGDATVNDHSPSGAHNQGSVSGYWGDAFHTYGIHRKSSSADVCWDGTLVKSYSTDDNGAGEELILNVGASSAYGSASEVKVDYVRVWQ